jgi:MFS family permease
MNPLLGRWIDRRGLMLPVTLGVAASTAVAVAFAFASSAAALAVLTVVAALTFGSLFTPGLALIAEGAERAGVAQALAFGTMSAAWALGNIIGPAGGGALARATSDRTAFLAAATVALASLVVFSRSAVRARIPARA